MESLSPAQVDELLGIYHQGNGIFPNLPKHVRNALIALDYIRCNTGTGFVELTPEGIRVCQVVLATRDVVGS